MRFDRAEQTGFGVAVGGHVLLFALLSAGFLATKAPLAIQRKPVEVQLVDETALESGAPELSDEAPAAKLAEVEAPVEPDTAPPPPEPTPEPPQPQPKPVAAPAPTPAPRPAKQPPAKKAAPAPAKPAPAKAKPSRPTGRLAGLLKGVSDDPSDSKSTAAPAATITPAVQSALAAAIRRQLKPHWKSPSGADVELLRTVVEVRLARDGSIVGQPQVVDQTGVNASNSSQAGLHRENAVRAVRLAAPFQLPPNLYDAWKVIRPSFDKRLSL